MTESNPDLYPIDLKPGTTNFEANGHTYFVEHNLKLSVTRDRWLEKYSLYATLGRDAKSLIAEAKRAYLMLNEAKIADAAVTLDNLVRGAADLSMRESPILYICTLFINREDEDRAGYDPEFAAQKIDAWKRLPKDFFLRCALSFLKITDEHLSLLTQISLGATLPVLDVLSQDLQSSSPSSGN